MRLEGNKCLDDALDVAGVSYALIPPSAGALGDLRVTPCEVAGQFAQVGPVPARSGAAVLSAFSSL